MTTAQATDSVILPEIAPRCVPPEGHADLAALFDAYKWPRNGVPLARAVAAGYDPLWLVRKHADGGVRAPARNLLRRPWGPP